MPIGCPVDLLVTQCFLSARPMLLLEVSLSDGDFSAQTFRLRTILDLDEATCQNPFFKSLHGTSCFDICLEMFERRLNMYEIMS